MKRIALLCSLLILSVHTPILADWNDGEPAKWVQMPDPTEFGIDVSCSYEYLLADDFLCQETGPITGIHIWGSWLDDFIPFNEDPAAVTFILSLHRDIPAEQSPTGYSMPGEVLWWRTFEPGEFQARIWSEGTWEGWMNPPDQFIYPADQIIWQYNFRIPDSEAFIQEGTPDQPIVYWLDVKAYPVDQNTQFGWKTSRDHWNDDAVWTFGDEPYSGLWEELRYPPGHEQEGQSIDLSFVIAMPEEPQERDYGDCPDSYRTLEGTAGPYHMVNQNYFLGNTIDAEPDGQPHPQALGDDINGIDDEDGVTFPPLIQGQSDFLHVVGGPLGGWLQGWVDFNSDGDFADAGDHVVSNLWINNGPNLVSITVPASAVPGQTFARFRISDVQNLGYFGPGSLGEVEDYEVYIEEDHPQTYKWIQPPDLTPLGIDVNATMEYLLADDFECAQSGPITEILIWGSWLDDHIPFGEDPRSVDFTLSFHRDIPADQSPTGYSMPGELLWLYRFPAGSFQASIFQDNIEEGWLNPPTDYFFPADWTCWLYRFTVPEAEAFFQEGTPRNPVVYWLDLQAEVLDPGAVFGWKTSQEHWNDDAVWVQAVEPYFGDWFELRYPPGHEQEGRSIDLAFAFPGEPIDWDFGDAPDDPPNGYYYPTWAAHSGARHLISPNIYMGNSIDSERDGQPDLAAMGDDNDGNDDEDGVIFHNTPLTPGAIDTVTVTVSVQGRLNAWIDFEGDGDWIDPIDQIFVDEPLAPGPNLLFFTVPATGMQAHTTYARFRFNTGGGLPFFGTALNGEVEDYLVEIATDLTDAPEDLPPQQFHLHRSVPNPFDESSLIRYDLPDAQFVDLSIFTIDGRRVATLVHDARAAGRHSAIWHGRDDAGQPVAPGIYFYRIEAGQYRHHGRMMMVR